MLSNLISVPDTCCFNATKKKKKSCWLNSFIYSKYNTYIIKCNKINDHACCNVLHLFCWLKYCNWQMLNRHMRHFSFWHSLIKVWRYMVKQTLLWLYEKLNVHAEKLTTPALLVISANTFEEAGLTVSSFSCESSSFGCFWIDPDMQLGSKTPETCFSISSELLLYFWTAVSERCPFRAIISCSGTPVL